jgi:hypothetical protein
VAASLALVRVVALALSLVAVAASALPGVDAGAVLRE